jgi:hypothetical protein
VTASSITLSLAWIFGTFTGSVHGAFVHLRSVIHFFLSLDSYLGNVCPEFDGDRLGWARHQQRSVHINCKAFELE